MQNRIRMLVLSLSLALLPATLAGASPSVHPSTPAANPVARKDFGMSNHALSGKVLLFGGWDGMGVLGDTWTWDGASWAQQFPASSPPARKQPAMAYDAPRGQIVLFGGVGGDGHILGDTWTWDGSNWTEQHPVTSPPPVNWDELAFDPVSKTVLMYTYGETWTWNGTNWAQQLVSGPPWRIGPAVSTSGPGVVLFGGAQCVENCVYEDDTWVWNGSGWRPGMPLHKPPVRYRAQIAQSFALHKVIMFGGQNDFFLRDTWAWDGHGWLVRFPSDLPPERAGGRLAYDSATRQLLLFGGENTTGELGDTWVFTGTTWTCLAGCA